MADNITLNAGSGGSTLRTDDDGTAHWPYSKIAFGADDTQTIVTAGVGLPVEVLSGTVTTVSTVTNLSQLGGAAVPIGAGLEATAVRVTLPTDGTGLVSAAQSGTWNITNVSGTISLPTGASTAANQSTANASLSSIDGKITACDTGAVVIASGTITLPVGASTAANQATEIASLASIDGKITAVNTGAVVISSGTITTVTTVGTVSSVSAVTPGTGATNLGKAEDAAHTTADVGVMGLAVRTDTPANRSGTDGDYEPLQMSAGRLWTSSTITSAIPGTSATSLGKAVDAVAGGSDTGVASLAVRLDTPAAITPAAGDYTPLRVNSLGQLHVRTAATATGGATPGKLISAASTNATSVKASAGTLFALCAFNTNAAVRYLKLYNKASAPTVGTDTPVMVFAIPGNTAGAGFVVPIPSQGIAFSTGIAFALTTGAADSDTGAVSANENIVTYAYN